MNCHWRGDLVVKKADPFIPKIRRDHVLDSPGAMRHVLKTKGKSPSCAATCPVIVALSQVSHGTILPLPSGRFATRFKRLAWTVSGFHPKRSGTWQTCIPKSPIQPYSPLMSIIRFQLMILSGLMSDECRNADSTSMISPTSPDLTNSITRCAPGKNGISEEHLTKISG